MCKILDIAASNTVALNPSLTGLFGHLGQHNYLDIQAIQNNISILLKLHSSKAQYSLSFKLCLGLNKPMLIHHFYHLVTNIFPVTHTIKSGLCRKCIVGFLFPFWCLLLLERLMRVNQNCNSMQSKTKTTSWETLQCSGRNRKDRLELSVGSSQ